MLLVFLLNSETHNYYTWPHLVIFLNHFVLLHAFSRLLFIYFNALQLANNNYAVWCHFLCWCLWSLAVDFNASHIDLFSCLSLQRRKSRCGVPHRRLLEHRRGQLHQSRAFCLRHDRRLRRHRTLRNAGWCWKRWTNSRTAVHSCFMLLFCFLFA